jgi:hypothetical protein
VDQHSRAFVGIDTSKLRNAVAVAEEGRGGDVRYFGGIDTTEAATRKLSQFLCSIREPFVLPDPPCGVTPSAAAVKDGRRSGGATCSAIDRPRLDGGKHSVMSPPGLLSFQLAEDHPFNGCYKRRNVSLV